MKTMVKNSVCYKEGVQRIRLPNSNKVRTESVMGWIKCRSLVEFDESPRVKVYNIELPDLSQSQGEVDPSLDGEDAPSSYVGYTKVITYMNPYADKMIEEMDFHWRLGTLLTLYI